jgi:hypothetical protein
MMAPAMATTPAIAFAMFAPLVFMVALSCRTLRRSIAPRGHAGATVVSTI